MRFLRQDNNSFHIREVGTPQELSAVVEVGEFLCEGPTASGDALVDLDVTIGAVARAVATVVSEVNLSCILTGEASANGIITSQARSRARTAATAVAGILDGRVDCPNCMARVEALINATREVFVEAALESTTEVCVPACDLNAQVLYILLSSASDQRLGY